LSTRRPSPALSARRERDRISKQRTGRAGGVCGIGYLFSPKERKKEEIRDEETPEWVNGGLGFSFEKRIRTNFFLKKQKNLSTASF